MYKKDHRFRKQSILLNEREKLEDIRRFLPDVFIYFYPYFYDREYSSEEAEFANHVNGNYNYFSSSIANFQKIAFIVGCWKNLFVAPYAEIGGVKIFDSRFKNDYGGIWLTKTGNFRKDGTQNVNWIGKNEERLIRLGYCENDLHRIRKAFMNLYLNRDLTKDYSFNLNISTCSEEIRKLFNFS